MLQMFAVGGVLVHCSVSLQPIVSSVINPFMNRLTSYPIIFLLRQNVNFEKKIPDDFSFQLPTWQWAVFGIFYYKIIIQLQLNACRTHKRLITIPIINLKSFNGFEPIKLLEELIIKNGFYEMVFKWLNETGSNENDNLF